MDIEEDPFETLDIVEVAINNETHEFRKIITNLENKGNMLIMIWRKMMNTEKAISIFNCYRCSYDFSKNKTFDHHINH